MATLTFNKVGDKYVAEFEATSDFAIHIERNESGFLYMEQPQKLHLIMRRA